VASELRQVGVELESLVKLLGDNLYSTPEVFLRELVQNAHDAITRRQIEAKFTDTGRIVVSVERDGKTPTVAIEDNGSGLTLEEIHRDLATIGRGVTRELRKAESAGNEARTRPELIGAFGLGFISAYVVSDLVTFTTTSYQTPDVTHVFASRGGNGYSVDRTSELRPVGSRVELRLKPECRHFGEWREVRRALDEHCSLLSHPIYMGSVDHDARINAAVPPWRLDPGMPFVRWHREAMNWIAQQPLQHPPVAVIPIGARPDAAARGIAWFHDFYSHINNDNRVARVYIRNMLVARNERELLPPWAGFVSTALEANGLTPTASREQLRKDAAYGSVQDQLVADLVAGLSELAAAPGGSPERALLDRIQARHSQSLMLACCVEPKLLAAMKDVIEIDTSGGLFTMPALEAKGDGRVYVSSTRSGIDGLFARVHGHPVVNGRIAGQRQFVERMMADRLDRLITLGQAGHEKLFQPAPADARLEALVKELVADGEDEVRLTAFEPRGLPLVRVWDEMARTLEALKRDEGARNVARGALRLAKQVLAENASAARSILYVNTASPVWSRLVGAEPGRRSAVAELLKSLVVLIDESAASEREAALAAALDRATEALVALSASNVTPAKPASRERPAP
jgi:molecular chaperone HtpG